MDWGPFWEHYWPEVAAGVSCLLIGWVASGAVPWVFERIGITTHKIRITAPAAMQGLTDKQPADGGGFTYEVRGRLSRLPKNHVIWLVVQDEHSSQIWPHCTHRVKYNADDGTWLGRVHIGPHYKTAKLIAVVAPPTTSDYFNYFCSNGIKTGWAPLRSLPVECKNYHEMTAVVT